MDKSLVAIHKLLRYYYRITSNGQIISSNRETIYTSNGQIISNHRQTITSKGQI